MAARSNAEDEFRPYYADDSLGAGMAMIAPPYNPANLQRVVSENNTLEPCIDAMITNIDLTGYIIEREAGTTPETDPGKDKLEEFFDEVFPRPELLGAAPASSRRHGADGQRLIEVLRNLENQIVFLRYVPARTIRCMRLDAPIVVEKTVIRDGQEITVPTLTRDHCDAQRCGRYSVHGEVLAGGRAGGSCYRCRSDLQAFSPSVSRTRSRFNGPSQSIAIATRAGPEPSGLTAPDFCTR